MRALLILLAALPSSGQAGETRAAAAAPTPPALFRAGTHVVDLSPVDYPVIVNAMFTERSASQVTDPLVARALVLDDGTNRLAFCVVDSCMVPRDLLDQAKSLAARATGIPTHRMLVSSTHTHSAPAAMGCLGSRVDPRYAASLPPRIATAIIGAAGRLAHARVGWTAYDDWDHTFNRRWIRRPDRLLEDPFGVRNVRAHMHPGHQSPDAIGPSGPVDPGFTLLALSTPDGRPLAVLGNYSQHYYGSPLLSSDYYGRFALHLAQELGADGEFTAILSQGTSGDQMWMDYGAPRNEIGYDAYAREMAARAGAAYRRIAWQDHAVLQMAERTIDLRFRVPDESRLAWARQFTAAMGDRLPANLREIYAWEALHLHARPTAGLILQAARIGDLGITAIPNEVYAITGLKLKARSPFPTTMNISLANGAEGYIPPPEQHALGGYTTWPARTAGLETQAEPRIVESLVSLLEEVADKPARPLPVEHGPYARAILDSQPLAYWRLDEMVFPTAADATGHGHDARFEDGVALYVPGAGSGTGVSPYAALHPSGFSGTLINRAVHTAGGRIRTRLDLGDAWTAELWIWNGLAADSREIAGYVFSRGPDADPLAPGDHLGIGGTLHPDHTGRLILFNGNERNQVLAGRTILARRAWHHVALVRDGRRVRVHLDGRPEPEIDAELHPTVPAGPSEVFLGGRSDGLFGFEGRIDEAALHPRALPAAEILAHYQAANLTPPTAVTDPLSPEASLAKIHVRPGTRVELMAAEPLTVDPVAIDWDAAGRLWVVEMSDYPLGLDGRGKPGGRVRILEDTNADGRPDRSTVFAEGLTFPTGLLTWRDGVLVTAPPEILFLRDTNGDRRADTREVVASGFLEGNQQLRANGLRWGLDNWVYCAAGGHHAGHGTGTRVRTRAGEFNIGSRDFRFRPDTGELEAQSGPSQFGRNRDDWGRWFGTQNIRPLWHYVLADHYLRRNPHVAAPDPTRQVVVPLSPRVWPASEPEKRYHSFDQAGHFTSACSGMIYQDDLLFGPPSAGRSHAFTCEPFHNLVQHNVLAENGVSFTASRDPAEEGREFFASEDRWCRPVMTRTGPDGALWVVDMYRYMIEHPEWLPATGRDELLPHYRLGDDRGRLYRVLPMGGGPRPFLRLDTLDLPALAAALDSSNAWQRDKAHQLLLHRADLAPVPILANLARSSTNPLARVHALAVLDGLGALESDLVAAAVADPHPGVRANALRLAETRGTPAVIAAAAARVTDPDAKVRLQLAFTLGEWKESTAGEALGRLALADPSEPFLRAAILSSAVPHVRALALALGPRTSEATFAPLTEPLADLALALSDRPALAALLGPILTPSSGDSLSASQMNALSRFLGTVARRAVNPADLMAGDDELAQSWRRIPAALDAVGMIFADGSRLPADRIAAAGVLTRHPATRAKALDPLGSWLAPRQPPEMQQAAIDLIATAGDDKGPGLLIAHFETLTPAIRTAVIDALLTREPWTRTLLERVGRNLLTTLDATRRTRLQRHTSARVRELAAAILEPVAGRAEVLAQYRPALGLTGDPARGEAVYLRLCVTCHKRGDAGHEVGPDLASVASHPPEKLLTNILDPGADIQPGYQTFQGELADGTELYGLIGAETGNSLTFKLPDGTTRTVLRSDLASLRGGTVSLMPEGLEAGLTPQDLADLIRFLRTPR